MSILGWVCLAIYAIGAAAMYLPNRNVTGDRGVGLIIPLMMVPAILLAAAILGFAQYKGWKTAVAVIAVLLTMPIFVVGPVVVGNLLSSDSAKRSAELRGQFRDPVLKDMGAAIRSLDVARLKGLVDVHPNVDWSWRDPSCYTLLGIAVDEALQIRIEGSSTECLRILVEAGAPFQDDAKGPNTRMMANLVTTLREDQTEVLRLLLRAGANPNERDNAGTPALIGVYMEAAKARVLLDAGAELASLRSSEEQFLGWDALMMAAMRGRWELALLYLERGCDPNYQTKDGMSAWRIVSEQDEQLNYQNEKINRNALLRALEAARAKAATGGGAERR